MGVAETIQVACTVAVTPIVAVVLDATADVEAAPSARTPKMGASSVDLIAFESFIE
jgi:hypothetical protein